MVAAHGDVKLRIEDETVLDDGNPHVAATVPDKA